MSTIEPFRECASDDVAVTDEQHGAVDRAASRQTHSPRDQTAERHAHVSEAFRTRQRPKLAYVLRYASRENARNDRTPRWRHHNRRIRLEWSSVHC